MTRKFTGLFIIMLAAAGILFAQQTQELRVNSFLSGNINPGQEIWFNVRPAQTGLFIIETDSTLDTYLEIYDAQRNFITSDDDSAGYPNARARFAVQANTNYLVKLRILNSDRGGSYIILADSKPMTELRSGAAVSGNIIYGQENWYNVRPNQSGYLIFETTGSTDTLLDAYDENFYFLASDDDSGDSLNARVRLQVAAGKTYFFAVKTYSEASSGAYRVQTNVQAFPTPTALSVGSFLNGTISSGGEYWYSVRAVQNGYLTVETTGNTNTHLIHYTDNYEYVTENDDFWTGDVVNYNAKIRIEVKAGKTYYYLLKGSDESTSGAYRIFANYQPYPAPTALAAGSFISAYIEYGNETWYSVRTTRSGNLTVETTGSTDTVLDLYTDSYEHLERNDDNDDYNARIRINNVRANTTYLFRLTSFNNGSYRIFANME